jgi:hypothetical protein
MNRADSVLTRSIKYLGVLIFFTLLCSHSLALQCQELFSSKDLPSNKRVRSSTEALEVPLYTALTLHNFEQVFTHNYDHWDLSRFGAKAVVTSLPGEPLQVYFFPSGKEKKSWNIHHVDAISVALNDPYGQLYYLRLPYLQGYEMTAKRINGRWAIIRLDINSTLTYLHANQPSRRPSLEREEEMLKALISRIDEDLQRFPMPDLDEM